MRLDRSIAVLLLLLGVCAGLIGVQAPATSLSERHAASGVVLPADGSPAPEEAGATVAGPKHPDGTEVQCDLPGKLHRRNTESRGLGNCVFTSIHHAGVYQNVPVVQEFPKWLISKGIPGGGYPQKVANLIPRMSKDRGLPEPQYLQAEGMDLDLLKAACASGRMPGITYSVSPTGRYGGSRIAHMVNLVAAGAGKGPDGKGWWVILDNNYPGESNYEWLSEAEFRRTYAPGWCVILLNPSPAPPPRNLKR